MHKLTPKQRQQRLHSILCQARQQATTDHSIAERISAKPSATLIALKKRIVQ